MTEQEKLDKYQTLVITDIIEKYYIRTSAELAAWDIFGLSSCLVEEAKKLINSNELKHISDKFRNEVIMELEKIPGMFAEVYGSDRKPKS